MLVLALSHGVVVNAAPPPRAGKDAKKAKAIKLVDQGYKKLEDGEYDSAAKLLEEAYSLLPESTRSEIALDLARAHMEAYKASVDPEAGTVAKQQRWRLDRITELVSNLVAQQKKDLPEGSESNSVLELLVDALNEAKQLELEAKKAQEAKDEETRKREQAEARQKDAETRQQEAEHRQEESAAEYERRIEAEREHTRKMRLHFYLPGSLLAGLGVTSWAGMAIGLWFGEKADSEGSAYIGEIESTMGVDEIHNLTDEQELELAEFRKNGAIANQAAWATGIIGGAMLITGTALMIIGARKDKAFHHAEQARPKQPRVEVGMSGVILRF